MANVDLEREMADMNIDLYDLGHKYLRRKVPPHQVRMIFKVFSLKKNFKHWAPKYAKEKA